MTAREGIEVTKDIVDNEVGYNLVQLLQAWEKCVTYNDEFLNKTAAPVNGVETYLTTLKLGSQTEQYSDGTVNAGDNQIADIRAQYAALKLLWKVANGQATVPNASDFFFNAPKLIGTNVVSTASAHT